MEGFFVGSLAAVCSISGSTWLVARFFPRCASPHTAAGPWHRCCCCPCSSGSPHPRENPQIPPWVTLWVCSGPWAGAISSREGLWLGMHVPFGTAGWSSVTLLRARSFQHKPLWIFLFPQLIIFPGSPFSGLLITSFLPANGFVSPLLPGAALPDVPGGFLVGSLHARDGRAAPAQLLLSRCELGNTSSPPLLGDEPRANNPPAPGRGTPAPQGVEGRALCSSHLTQVGLISVK